MKFNFLEILYSEQQHRTIVEQSAIDGQLFEYMSFVIQLHEQVPSWFNDSCLCVFSIPKFYKQRAIQNVIQDYCTKVVNHTNVDKFILILLSQVNRHTFQMYAESLKQIIYSNPTFLKNLHEQLLLSKNIIVQKFAFSQLLQNPEIMECTEIQLTEIYKYLQSFLQLLITLDQLMNGTSNTILQIMIQLLTQLDILSGVMKGAQIKKTQQQQQDIEDNQLDGSMQGSITMSMRAMGSFKTQAKQIKIQDVQQTKFQEVDYDALHLQIVNNQVLLDYLDQLFVQHIDLLFCAAIQFLQQKDEQFMSQSFIPLYFQFILPNNQLRFSQFLAFPLLQITSFQEELLKQLFITAFANANVNFHAAVAATSYMEGLIARCAIISPDFLNQILQVILQYVNEMDSTVDIQAEFHKSGGRQLKCEFLNPGIQRYLLGARCLAYIFCFQWQNYNFELIGDQFVKYLQNDNQPFRCFRQIAEQVCARLNQIGVDDSVVSDQLTEQDIILLPHFYPFEPISLEGANRYIEPFYRYYDQ